MIKVRNLKKSFDGNMILKGIDLDIEQKDVIAIIGKSGSGKTTLLRCLNFLEIAEEGNIEFDGIEYDMKTINKKQIAQIRKKTAFVFQNFNLYSNKTVLENVSLALIVGLKVKKEEAIEKSKKLLDKVGLNDKYDAYPSQLSGGQQQRVAIARALATDPEIIFFDEPTSALDPELINEVLKVIRGLAEEGITMLIVTHEMNFARNVSNKTIFMDDGKIAEFSSSKTFFENPKNIQVKQFLQKIEEERK